VALAYDDLYRQFLNRALAYQAHELYREAARLLREHADARADYLRRHFGIVTDQLDEIVALRARASLLDIRARTSTRRNQSRSTPQRPSR
jgi:hypothetical protein